MNNYILLNQAFCTLNNGHRTDKGQFFFRQTISGDWVCAEQSLYDFPELFQGEILIPGITIIQLSIIDFPVQPRN